MLPATPSKPHTGPQTGSSSASGAPQHSSCSRSKTSKAFSGSPRSQKLWNMRVAYNFRAIAHTSHRARDDAHRACRDAADVTWKRRSVSVVGFETKEKTRRFHHPDFMRLFCGVGFVRAGGSRKPRSKMQSLAIF